MSETNSSSSGTDEEIRLLFLGSGKVGKTSIIQRFLHNRFETKYTPTVEDVHFQKYIVHNYLVKLFLIDTSGSYDFPAMLRLCIAKASAFVLVFAHNNLESLHQASRILAQIKSERKDYVPLGSIDSNKNLNIASPPIVVVCNKSDLPNSDSQISEGTIMEWLLTNKFKPTQFVYASAKSSESILSIFESLWLQNCISKTIRLSNWNTERRASLNNQQQSNHNRPRPNSTSTSPSYQMHNFSAIFGQIFNYSQTDLTNDSNSATKVGKTKSGIFRNNLCLTRVLSGKVNKKKLDLMYLNCNVS